MEYFKTIKGYENYQISNYGNVLSVKKGIFLKKVVVCGYECVNLCVNGKKKMHKVHRLVAEAFLPNPNNYPCVNHKDEDKTNNFIWVNDDGTVDPLRSNLEWCSSAYNNAYGTRGKRISAAISGEKHYLYGKQHTEEFKRQVSEKLKGRPSPNKGKRASEETRLRMSVAHRNITETTRNKMKINYLQIKEELIKSAVESNRRVVNQYDKEGNLVKVWSSIKEAGDALGLNTPNIIACCKNKQKTCGGYVWRY